IRDLIVTGVQTCALPICNLGLPNRALVADLEARRRLAGALRQLRPRALFAPYWEDSHPDHIAASALVDAARFWAKLTKTDLPGQIGRASCRERGEISAGR